MCPIVKVIDRPLFAIARNAQDEPQLSTHPSNSLLHGFYREAVVWACAIQFLSRLSELASGTICEHIQCFVCMCLQIHQNSIHFRRRRRKKHAKKTVCTVESDDVCTKSRAVCFAFEQ